jgi:hypothetical protein
MDSFLSIVIQFLAIATDFVFWKKERGHDEKMLKLKKCCGVAKS